MRFYGAATLLCMEIILFTGQLYTLLWPVHPLQFNSYGVSMRGEEGLVPVPTFLAGKVLFLLRAWGKLTINILSIFLPAIFRLFRVEMLVWGGHIILGGGRHHDD
jgi:hypothetical protein